jgi:hypothetical protein
MQAQAQAPAGTESSISTHVELDRDNYWMDLAREQFESNAKKMERVGTKWLVGLAGLSFSGWHIES